MMDTSKKYIEMCEKAEEIQKLRPNPIEYTRGIDGVNTVLYDYEGNLWFNRDGEDLIWLPRQDQLQGIFGNFNRCYNELVGLGCDIGTGNADEKEVTYIEDFTSMEQLWLAFVMKEKWNKVWDGKEWVKYIKEGI